MSKYWHLDTLWWFTGNFKLIHQEMLMFTLNFKCQQTPKQADESTIPIIFKKIFLYITPEYRKRQINSFKNQVLNKEFKRALNYVDNFTSMCYTSSDLFSFLDYYHEAVIKTKNLVSKFFKLISKYKSVYRNHPEL